MTGEIGAPFKAITTKLETTEDKPMRDDSKYGAPFKAVGQPKGIPCPDCGCRHYTKTVDSVAQKNRIQRKKNCKNCGKQFITYEQLPGTPKVVDAGAK